jgi:nitroimidazol reductase NimA-like FMN-containing flavoprotein (pyridoxamine 5'-phosphate oxidase superfamily)
MVEPRTSRPHMPGYGIVGPHEGRGLLPWSWAEERLVTSHDYWLATVSPMGGPHVMPVWGVWAGGAAWFSSSSPSRKARNIACDPRAVITTDNPRQPVVVQGRAESIVDDQQIERFTSWVNAKYETDLPVSFFADNACFRLDPRCAFGLDDADFTSTPTRWDFGDELGTDRGPLR